MAIKKIMVVDDSPTERAFMEGMLKKRGYEPTKELVTAVLGEAKRGNRVLSDDEIVAVIRAASPS